MACFPLNSTDFPIGNAWEATASHSQEETCGWGSWLPVVRGEAWSARPTSAVALSSPVVQACCFCVLRVASLREERALSLPLGVSGAAPRRQSCLLPAGQGTSIPSWG